MLLEQALRLDKKNGTEKFTETLYQFKLARIRRKEPGWRPQKSLKQTSKLQDHVERKRQSRRAYKKRLNCTPKPERKDPSTSSIPEILSTVHTITSMYGFPTKGTERYIMPKLFLFFRTLNNFGIGYQMQVRSLRPYPSSPDCCMICSIRVLVNRKTSSNGG